MKSYTFDKEELQYDIKIQAILGNKLHEIGVEEIDQFITGIGKYFFQLNAKLEELLNSISKKVSEKNKEELKKKWQLFDRFSGTLFQNGKKW